MELCLADRMRGVSSPGRECFLCALDGRSCIWSRLDSYSAFWRNGAGSAGTVLAGGLGLQTQQERRGAREPRETGLLLWSVCRAAKPGKEQAGVSGPGGQSSGSSRGWGGAGRVSQEGRPFREAKEQGFTEMPLKITRP